MGIELAGHQQTNTGYTIPMPDLTGLPPEAGPVLDLMQQNQPMVIVAGTVGITALSEDERRALLAEIDVADALARAADIQAQWDVASTTHWNLKPLHLDLLLPASDDWMPAVRAEVNKGNIFAAPQVMVQFMRELLEADSTASRKLAADELVRLLISIATEQQLNAEFKSDTPTPPAEFRALDEKYKAMTPRGPAVCIAPGPPRPECGCAVQYAAQDRMPQGGRIRLLVLAVGRQGPRFSRGRLPQRHSRMQPGSLSTTSSVLASLLPKRSAPAKRWSVSTTSPMTSGCAATSPRTWR